MSETPSIPYGYKAVIGQLQKGDAIWNGKRFAKVKRGYPFIGMTEGLAIRKCEVIQQEVFAAPAEEVEFDL